MLAMFLVLGTLIGMQVLSGLRAVDEHIRLATNTMNDHIASADDNSMRMFQQAAQEREKMAASIRARISESITPTADSVVQAATFKLYPCATDEEASRIQKAMIPADSTAKCDE